MDIVQATELLAAATAGLVVLGGLQYLAARRQAADQLRATEVLETQAEALAASARATQAMADEMLEERRAARPLRVVVARRDAPPGIFDATIRGVYGQATILRRVSLHVGQGMGAPDAPVVAEVNFGNAYPTGADGQYVRATFATPPFDTATGDLLVVRVTGRPQDGLEQTREFLYRIEANRTLTNLDPADMVEAVYGPIPGSRR